MRITTPAKIILSGEHSVVHGAPAIGAPLGMYLESRWAARDDGAVHIEGEEAAPAWDALAPWLAAARARHAGFRAGTCGIRAVLPRPRDLALLALAVFRESVPDAAPRGLSLSFKSDIPVSSGFGSSASLVVNLLRGMEAFTGTALQKGAFFDVARGIENFQHGVSSGMDIALVSSAAPLAFVKDRGVTDRLSLRLPALRLVHTGAPASGTGECVARVRERFGDDKALWDGFSACTLAMRAALEAGDMKAAGACIRENHALLCRIGVVPEKVRGFIAACAARGLPAKVCGAGAVAGDAAGAVWVLARDEDSVQDLDALATEHGYTHGAYAIAA